MKPCGCDFCNDLRYIEPAKYIGGGDDDFKTFINKAKEQKQFIYHYFGEGRRVFTIVSECPVCGYKFTEEDYDSYS